MTPFTFAMAMLAAAFGAFGLLCAAVGWFALRLIAGPWWALVAFALILAATCHGVVEIALIGA